MESLTSEHVLGLVVLMSGFLLLRMFSSGRVTNEDIKRLLESKPEERQSPRRSGWKLPVGIAVASIGLLLPLVLSLPSLRLLARGSAEVDRAESPVVISHLDAETERRLEMTRGVLRSGREKIQYLKSAGSSPMERAVFEERVGGILKSAYAQGLEGIANEAKLLTLLHAGATHPEDSNANFRLASITTEMRIMTSDRKSLAFNDLYHLRIDETEGERRKKWRSADRFRVFLMPYFLGVDSMTEEEAWNSLEVSWGANPDMMEVIPSQGPHARIERSHTQSERARRFVVICVIPTKYLEPDGEAYVRIRGELNQNYPFSQLSFEAQRFLKGVDRFVARVVTYEEDESKEPNPGLLEAFGFRAEDGLFQRVSFPEYDRDERRWVYSIEEDNRVALERVIAFTFPYVPLNS